MQRIDDSEKSEILRPTSTLSRSARGIHHRVDLRRCQPFEMATAIRARTEIATRGCPEFVEQKCLTRIQNTGPRALDQVLFKPSFVIAIEVEVSIGGE